MAEIVVGIGTCHSPQLKIPLEKWDTMRLKDERDPRLDYQSLLRGADPRFAEGATLEKWGKQHDAVHKALGVMSEVLLRSQPDVIVVIGDDQKENLLDDNMPMFCVYRGATLPVQRRKRRPDNVWARVGAAEWMEIAERGLPEIPREYPGEPELAEHLVRHLSNQDFDLACSNQLREEVGLGHAFTFLYEKLLPESCIVPLVPFMVNTYYPPNQPSPRRCYALGQALRRAVEAWKGDKRVAIVASGGLSHVVLDEELDRLTIDAMRRKDKERLCSLPRERLKGGTSETLNFVTLSAAMEPVDMELVDYVPVYRTPAGTGHGMTFAYWQ
jgi:hypothetical protein